MNIQKLKPSDLTEQVIHWMIVFRGYAHLRAESYETVFVHIWRRPDGSIDVSAGSSDILENVGVRLNGGQAHVIQGHTPEKMEILPAKEQWLLRHWEATFLEEMSCHDRLALYAKERDLIVKEVC